VSDTSLGERIRHEVDRRGITYKAAAVQDVTGATISDTEIMRLAHDRDEVYA